MTGETAAGSEALAYTPAQIVEYLDRYIVGQEQAKRAVALAIRNRWRRLQLDERQRQEITPKNILLIGPTGVGKTEIARRLAQLLRAPFVKVEATKFTEVGYVGRDVESMVRDLVKVAIALVREEQEAIVRAEAEARAEARLVDVLLSSGAVSELTATDPAARGGARERLRDMLRRGVLDNRRITLELPGRKVGVRVVPLPGMEQLEQDLERMFRDLLPKPPQTREMTVAEARKIFIDQELEKLLDEDKITQEALRRAEESGIIFVDELDKICATGTRVGGDVSREGVQRDLLPIIEGTTVSTRYGSIRTDFILFIGAGAFHMARPSDLMPELQGRFPIRVELHPLKKEDFLRILKEPESSIIRQYQALLRTEGVELTFRDDALEAIADIAYRVNRQTQDIGARRLHTIVERVLEDVSFDAPALSGQTIVVDRDYVLERLKDVVTDEDLARYVL